MNEQDFKTANIEFRKVYLSDLGKIVNIYKKGTEPTAAGQLTADFGLPLIIATLHHEVIGFASAAINELEKTTLNSYCVTTFNDSFIGNELEEEGRKVLQSTFQNIAEDHTQLAQAIQRLIVWLNKCSI